MSAIVTHATGQTERRGRERFPPGSRPVGRRLCIGGVVMALDPQRDDGRA